MNQFPDYNVEMTEVHHTQKLDAPSGTAITLAEGILENIDRKTKWVKETETRADEIAIKSLREGQVPGIHTIRYEKRIFGNGRFVEILRRLHMKTFEVELTKTYKVIISTDNEYNARALSEFFTGDITNLSAKIDEENNNFEIKEIECLMNEANQVIELEQTND